MSEPEHPWEELNSESGSYTDRMKVPGGWIYRTVVFSDTGDGVTAASVAVSLSIVFVPSAPLPTDPSSWGF